MAAYRIEVEGSEAQATIPDGPGALPAAEAVAKALASAFRGSTVRVWAKRAVGRPESVEQTWRAEQVERWEVCRVRGTGTGIARNR